MDNDSKRKGNDTRKAESQSERKDSVIIGVDPGITGAWSVRSKNGVEVFDLPVVTITSDCDTPAESDVRKLRPRRKTKKKPKLPLRVIDTFALFKAFKGYGPTRIVIEQVGSRPTDARKTAFMFGGCYHSVLNAANECKREWGCDVRLVSPQKWKAKLGLIGRDKDASRTLAIAKYPTLSKTLKRKKDHNRAEAVLIGTYTEGLTV